MKNKDNLEKKLRSWVFEFQQDHEMRHIHWFSELKRTLDTIKSNSFILHTFFFWKYWVSFLFLKKDFIYLFLERGEGREKERVRHSNVWLLLAHPHQRPKPQPRHVPWLGIELATLWFSGRHSIHWATPARAIYIFLKILFIYF